MATRSARNWHDLRQQSAGDRRIHIDVDLAEGVVLPKVVQTRTVSPVSLMLKSENGSLAQEYRLKVSGGGSPMGQIFSMG